MGEAARDGNREIERANFRLIEKELYHYEARKKELAWARADIINETVISDVPIHTGPGNPTLTKVIRMDSGRLLETGRRLDAIEYAIRVIKTDPEPKKWDLARKKYFERRLTDEGIMLEVDIPRTNFYRWRREFIELIADRLGWEV